MATGPFEHSQAASTVGVSRHMSKSPSSPTLLPGVKGAALGIGLRGPNFALPTPMILGKKARGYSPLR